MTDPRQEFLDRCQHFYAQIDGSFEWPNSREGDLLKIAYQALREGGPKLPKYSTSGTSINCRICGDNVEGHEDTCPIRALEYGEATYGVCWEEEESGNRYEYDNRPWPDPNPPTHKHLEALAESTVGIWWDR